MANTDSRSDPELDQVPADCPASCFTNLVNAGRDTALQQTREGVSGNTHSGREEIARAASAVLAIDSGSVAKYVADDQFVLSNN